MITSKYNYSSFIEILENIYLYEKKLSLGACKNIFNQICLQIMYIQYICIKRIWH